MAIDAFNNFIGNMCEPRKVQEGFFANIEAGAAKAGRAYNIKAGLYNTLTVSLVYGVAVMLFSSLASGLLIAGLSFAGRRFINEAMNETWVGSSLNTPFNSTIFFKRFIV